MLLFCRLLGPFLVSGRSRKQQRHHHQESDVEDSIYDTSTARNIFSTSFAFSYVFNYFHIFSVYLPVTFSSSSSSIAILCGLIITYHHIFSSRQISLQRTHGAHSAALESLQRRMLKGRMKLFPLSPRFRKSEPSFVFQVTFNL